MSKKIGVIGIRGLPSNYGAFDSFVDQFVQDQKILRSNLIFLIGTNSKNSNKKFKYLNVKQIYTPRFPGPFVLFTHFISIILMLIYGVRIFLFFGYGPAIFFPILKLLNCKIICNPDGIEWRRPNNFIKKYYFKICERIFGKIEISKIYDSEVINRYYSYKYRSKGETVYYPSKFENFKSQALRDNTSKRFYVIGRLLEENNISLIVNTFKRLSQHKLFIIGYKSSYFEKEILPKIVLSKNIFYVGQIYNKEKLYKYLSFFDYYIHGHKVGGTNPTLIEAISLKKKIFAYNCSFNREILGKKNVYFKSSLDLENLINFYSDYKYEENIYKESFTQDFINNKYLKIISEEF